MNGRRTVSKKAVVIWFVVVVALFVAMLAFLFGYLARGKAIEGTMKKLEACEKAAKKPQQAVKKPLETVKKQRPIVASGIYVPAPTPAPRLFTLRLNVVEWNGAGGELFSRNVGPAIREGMADGSIVRTALPVSFKIIWKQGAERLAGKAIWINGESRILPLNFSPNYPVEVAAKNGLATIEMPPDMIGPETMICVWPSVGNGAKFISPPQNLVGEQLPLLTTPGELELQVKNEVQDVYMHFIVRK